MSKRFSRLVAAGLFCLSSAFTTLPASAQLATGTLVRMDTALGPVDFELYDTKAPNTVANFLKYVRRKSYDNSILHRSVPTFVIQGGGYYLPTPTSTLTRIANDGTVNNEYGADRPNVRGSVAMAKVSGNPNSATTEWFVNLRDNTTTLGPPVEGGYTVFARVTATSMAVVDALAALRRINCGSPYNELPLLVVVNECNQITASNLLVFTSVRELPARATTNASDRIFNYLEARYPQYAAPTNPTSGTFEGYYYRFYSRTGYYAGTKDGTLYYYAPAVSPDIVPLGSVADWLAQAIAAGY